MIKKMIEIASLHLPKKPEFFYGKPAKIGMCMDKDEVNMLENPYNNFGLTILMDLRYNLIL